MQRKLLTETDRKFSTGKGHSPNDGRRERGGQWGRGGKEKKIA